MPARSDYEPTPQTFTTKKEIKDATSRLDALGPQILSQLPETASPAVFEAACIVLRSPAAYIPMDGNSPAVIGLGSHATLIFFTDPKRAKQWRGQRGARNRRGFKVHETSMLDAIGLALMLSADVSVLGVNPLDEKHPGVGLPANPTIWLHTHLRGVAHPLLGKMLFSGMLMNGASDNMIMAAAYAVAAAQRLYAFYESEAPDAQALLDPMKTWRIFTNHHDATQMREHAGAEDADLREITIQELIDSHKVLKSSSGDAYINPSVSADVPNMLFPVSTDDIERVLKATEPWHQMIR